MADGEGAAARRWCVTDQARRTADLPVRLERLLEDDLDRSAAEGSVVVACASEVIAGGETLLPTWVDTETFFLVFHDVPLPAVMRLPSLLGLHKPDRRLHLTRDPGTLRRLLVASHRSVPMGGIVDAYLVADELVLMLGDLTVRSFPRQQVPGVGRLPATLFTEFEIDPDGSYLRWPEEDVDLGVSGLLQAVDPMYLADVEIDRLSREDVGGALRELREERGLRQRDVPGLSERQVRRLEKGTSRLTAEAAGDLAEAFGLSLSRFLDLLAARTREQVEREEVRR